MLNFKPILLVIGTLLTILAISMIIPAIFDMVAHNQEWVSFLISSFLTAFVGISLVLTNQGATGNLNLRQAFIITTGSWTVLAAFAALPFWFSELGLSYTDSFFEAMSGITTTGATIMVGLDFLPPGILLWRSTLQWMGGIGIIVMALAILPMLKIGGMQLFKTESSDKSDKILPRTAQVSIAIGSVYLLLTVICAVLLWSAGMGEFDAVNHAMTTIATSGFSTHDNSIGYFNNPTIEYIIAFFMVASAIPFVLYIKVLRGRIDVIWKDTQVRLFFLILFLSVVTIIFWLIFKMGFSVSDSIRLAVFNIISVTTTTGFSTTDYSLWGGFAVTFIFLLSVVGGCTGSTSGGIKIFRYQVLYQTAKTQINHLIQPHAVIRARFNGKPIPETVTSSVMSFIILFAFSFLVLAVILAMSGLDYLSSMSAAAATLANLGPALGPIVGPSGNYSSIADFTKWILSFAMLLGRLEIFTVLVLFSSYFWRD